MANAFSNPSLYLNFKPVQTEDWNLALNLASFKRKEYDAGEAEVDQLMQSIVQTPIDNIQAKDHLKNRLNTLVSEVDALGSSAEALSNKGTRENILAHIGSALDDTTIHAIGATKNRINYQAKWEAIKSKNPELYNATNEAYGMAGYDEYIKADKNADVNSFVKNRFAVVPYVNIGDKMSKVALDLIKEKGKREYTTPIVNSEGVTVGYNQMVEVGLDNEALRNIFSATLSDSNTMAQLQVDAWSKYGGYSEAGVSALSGDFEKAFNDRIQDLESKKDFYKTQANGATGEDKSRFEKSYKDIEDAIVREKGSISENLRKIKSGQFVNASVNLVANEFISGQTAKFSTLYDNYQNGVKADELFWKNEDHKLKQMEFNYKVKKDERDYNLELEKLSESKRTNDISLGIISPENNYVVDNEETAIGEMSPYEVGINELNQINNNRVGLIKEYISDIDDLIKADGNSVETREAISLRNNYINHLYFDGVKRGVKMNREDMKKMSIQELSNRYGDPNGNSFFAVSRRMKDSFKNLSVLRGEDRIGEIQSIENDYKIKKSDKDAVDNVFSKSLQDNVFTKSFRKDLMSEDVNVFSNGKVTTSKKAFGNLIDSKTGEFKSGVTQAQKEAMFKDLNKTYEIQKYIDSKDEKDLKKLAIAIGGNPDDVQTYVETIRDKKTAVSRFKYNSPTEKKLNDFKIMRENNVLPFTANTNLAKDIKFSNYFEKGHRKAISDRDEEAKRRIEPTLYSNRSISIAFKNGKVENRDAILLAQQVQRLTSDMVDTSDTSSLKITKNTDNSFNVSYMTKTKDEDGKGVNMIKHIRVERDFIANNIPSLANTLNLSKSTSTAPVYTYGSVGTKSMSFKAQPYYSGSDKPYLEAKAKGNPDVYNAMTYSGAYNTIKNSVPQAFKLFDGFDIVFAEKLKDAYSDLSVEVKYEAGGKRAMISLIDERDGNNRRLATDYRPVVNNNIDGYVKVAEKTPHIYINELISQIIYENYINPTHSEASFERLFGKVEVKKDTK